MGIIIIGIGSTVVIVIDIQTNKLSMGLKTTRSLLPC